MNVKVESIEKNVVQLEIEVEAQKFEEGLQKSYKKNVNKFNVPGFRKGKVPRNIIERYYGTEVLYEDAVNFICPEAYDQAVEENNIEPVDKPELDIKEIGKGQNLVFTAKVTVKPEVGLGEYKGVEVEKVEVNVADEEVESELQKVAEKNARVMTVEDRGIEKDDVAMIDFEGFIDGEAFEGGKGTNFSLIIGSGQFIPGFEDQLVGVKAGDEVDVNVAFPEDYGKEELAGKPALFKVKINDVKTKELPTVDDEFAKDVSEFDTLEEYKESIKKDLVEKAEHKAKHETEDRVIEKVVENSSVDIPEVMKEKRVDDLVYDFAMRIRYQGLELDKYLEIMGKDMAEFREQFNEKAEKDVKAQLVIEKISKEEKVETSEDELNEEIKKLAENYNENEEEFKKHLREDDIQYIKSNLIFRKTVQFLVDNAKIV